MSIYIVLYGYLWIYLIQLKRRCIDEHNVNIINMIYYVAYIYNNLFLHFSYAPHQNFSMLSMTNDIPSQKQFCLKKIQYTHILCFILCIMYSIQSQKTTGDP